MRKPYRSELPDAQWDSIKGLMPAGKSVGSPRKVELREVLNTLMYQARTGCRWEFLPHDLLAKSTAWDYFIAWRKDGTWQKIVDSLRGQIRKEAGREETPSAACIDTQTIKTMEIGGAAGYDGNKKTRAANVTLWWTRWVYCLWWQLRRRTWMTGLMLGGCWKN